MSPLSAENIARNDSAFREANEQIRAKGEEHTTRADQLVPFLCECADTSCTTLLQLTLPEYEGVRADPRQFLNAIGHDRVEGLVEVIFTNHTYLIVRKGGRAGEVAEELDPRSDGQA